MGPKPSITIDVINAPNNEYLLDLLTKPTSFGGFSGTSNFEEYRDYILKDYEEFSGQPIHTYSEDGYLAAAIRNSLLWASHNDDQWNFDYIGVPREFKIIIQDSEGNLRVSPLITNSCFNCYHTLDYQNMAVGNDYAASANQLVNQLKNKYSLVFLISLLVCLPLTLLVEVLLALFMKIFHQLKLIIITNIITQVFTQFMITFGFGIFRAIGFTIGFLWAELVVFVTEYLIYSHKIKNQTKAKILAYTIIANLLSALLTFLPFNLVLYFLR
jgi:hypothetical protein